MQHEKVALPLSSPVEQLLVPSHYDLVTPDGAITAYEWREENPSQARATLFIQKISSRFVGFQLPKDLLCFNLKSTIAQLGVNATATAISLNRAEGTAELSLSFQAYGKLGNAFLKLLSPGAHVGRIFAADDRRRVRHPNYISRMFGRADRAGRPLLSLGALHGSDELVLDVVEGRVVAYLMLQPGQVVYEPEIFGFLPTILRALHRAISMRQLLALHQKWVAELPRHVTADEILLVKTLPLHIRTVFARVVDSLLPAGYHHTSAAILQPDTHASGDLYELYGESRREISDIPIEFYTLEPYREHVFFSDRDQLLSSLEQTEHLFAAFNTAPEPKNHGAAVFIVKGSQLASLRPDDWIEREPWQHELPGLLQSDRQSLMVERYIEKQPSYPWLRAIEEGVITSQGVLLSRYFLSPMIKRLLMSNQVRRCLKGIYFQQPSLSGGVYFSSEDRALLHDLYKFAIPVFWVDAVSHAILKYSEKPDHDSGLFVPLESVHRFLSSTVFGIYGSTLVAGSFEPFLRELFSALLNLRQQVTHPLMHEGKELALITGGGPGAMAVGNQIAKELGLLSCANIVDFSNSLALAEQKHNPHIEAKMTYRLDKLVERQAEFNLDFPLFLTGGIGTDFEFSLEEVRRKVGATPPVPVLLLGTVDYWKEKITARYHCNLKHGTIAGSEWVSNCFYCVQNSQQAIAVYERFFSGDLSIGPNGPSYDQGFVSF